jgi:hypothetical protein
MIKKLMSATKPYIPYFPFAIVAVVMIAVTIFALLRLAQPPEPPLHYTAAEYPAARPVYAPMETMIYTPTLIVKQEGRIDVLRSFWSRTLDSAALLCDGSPAPTIEARRNLPAGTVGDIRGGRAVLVPIPNLPPGDYWLISSATGPGGGQSVYQTPFRVVRACGGS